jgi:putative DNA primase/helicase
MATNPFAPVPGGSTRTASAAKVPSKGSIVVPVPADAPLPPDVHPTLGKPSAPPLAVHRRRRPVARLCLPVRRSQGKAISPPDGMAAARWRPVRLALGVLARKTALYGLQRLAERPSAPVVVCEGEKAADACTALLPGFVAVTSPNGSKSAKKADWSPLRTRDVVVWPDADAAGIAYAKAVSELVADGAADLTTKNAGRPRRVPLRIIRLPVSRLGRGRCARRGLAPRTRGRVG